MSTSRAPLLTVDQVAERLQQPAWTVRQRIRRGDLPAHNIGTARKPMYRVSEQQLADYLGARIAVSA